MTFSIPVAEHLKRIKPYVPGKPIAEVQRELGLTDVIKLASNENPLGPSPRAVEALAAAASHVQLYPEGGAPALRSAVSALIDVPPDHLIFGNGSDEILHMLSLAYISPGDQTVQAFPTFSMYEVYATMCNAEIVNVPLKNYTYDLEAMGNAVTPRTRLIFVANPDNPAGTLVTQDAVERFLDRLPDTALAVFDEAYYEYVDDPGRPDLRRHVLDGRPIVLTRTFSKVYGMAGLRIGYGIAHPEIIMQIERVRSPFNVNLPAQEAAVAAVGDQEHVKKAVALNAEGRRAFYDAFDRLGLEYVPSQTNFVLVDVKRDSREVFEALQRKGVIVRPGAGIGYPTHIRVTTGLPEQNTRFIKALTEVLGKS